MPKSLSQPLNYAFGPGKDTKPKNPFISHEMIKIGRHLLIPITREKSGMIFGC